MVRQPLRLLLPAALLGLASLFTAAAAQPQVGAATAAPIEVIILHGTNDGTGIDPKIGRLPELAKPPFNSYNSYKLLDRSRHSLTKQQAASVRTPAGAVLRVVLKDILEPRKRDEARRHMISVSIDKAGRNRFLPLLEVTAKAGEHFFIAGQEYRGGILAFGLKVAP